MSVIIIVLSIKFALLNYIRWGTTTVKLKVKVSQMIVKEKEKNRKNSPILFFTRV